MLQLPWKFDGLTKRFLNFPLVLVIMVSFKKPYYRIRLINSVSRGDKVENPENQNDDFDLLKRVCQADLQCLGSTYKATPCRSNHIAIHTT